MKLKINGPVTQTKYRDTFVVTVAYMWGDADHEDDEEIAMPSEDIVMKAAEYLDWYLDHSDDYGYEDIPKMKNQFLDAIWTGWDDKIFTKEKYTITGLNYKYIKKEYGYTKDEIDPLFKTEEFIKFRDKLGDDGNRLRYGKFIEGLGIGAITDWWADYYDMSGVKHSVDALYDTEREGKD